MAEEIIDKKQSPGWGKNLETPKVGKKFKEGFPMNHKGKKFRIRLRSGAEHNAQVDNLNGEPVWNVGEGQNLIKEPVVMDWMEI